MTTIETVAVVAALLLFIPIGDELNKYIRTGGTHKPRWHKHKRK